MFGSKKEGKHSSFSPGFASLYGKAACPVKYELKTEDKIKKAAVPALRLWTAIGALILLCALGYALGKISIAVQVLLIAFVVSFLITPLVNFLESKGLTRVLGTLIAYILGLALVSFVLVLVLPVLSKQVSELVHAIPYYAATTQTWVENLYGKYGSLLADSQVREISQKLFGTVSSKAWQFVNSSAMGIITVGSSFATMVATVFMGLVVAFWLTMDFPRFHREALIIAGPKRAEDFEIMAAVFGRAMGGYIKGLLITSACTGLIAGLGFFMLGVPYAGLLGLATAILNIIPFVGPWIGGGLAAIVALFVNPVTALLSVVVTIVAQQLTDTFISPKVMQSAVSVHPLLVIIGLTAAGAVGGVVGMIFVVPLMAACKGVFTYYFEKRTGRQLVHEEGAVFRGKPFNDEMGMPIPAFDATGGSKYYSAKFARASSQHNIELARKQEQEDESEPSKFEEVKDMIIDKVQEVVQDEEASKDCESDNHTDNWSVSDK